MWSCSAPAQPTVSHSVAQRKRCSMSKNIFWRCRHQRFDQLHLLGVADSAAKTSHFDILDETLHLTASVCSHYSSKRVSTHLALDGFLASSVLVNLVRISMENLHSVFKSPVIQLTRFAHSPRIQRSTADLCVVWQDVCERWNHTRGGAKIVQQRPEKKEAKHVSNDQCARSHHKDKASMRDIKERQKKGMGSNSKFNAGTPHGTPWEARRANCGHWTLKVRMIGHLASPGGRARWS